MLYDRNRLRGKGSGGIEMSYSRWGGSNWYAYASECGLMAHYAQGKSYCFSADELREGLDACLSLVTDGSEHDRAELREIMAEYLEDEKQ